MPAQPIQPYLSTNFYLNNFYQHDEFRNLSTMDAS